MVKKARDFDLREKTQESFGYVEDLLYVLVALALMAAGGALFVSAVYEFVKHFGEDMSTLVLDLLDALLLVFIITELIHTIRTVIDEKILVSEPFLVVGVVAAIRRLVVVSAEAKDLIGKPEFSDAMLEIGILVGGIFLLAAAIFMLRHTESSEPRPTHEPD